jgi:lipoprotein-anchoring transpeptidase ErfK/SrfK
MLLSRRTLLTLPLAAGLAPVAHAKTLTEEPFPVSDQDDQAVEYKFRRQAVDFQTSEVPATIVVNPVRHWLYLTLGGGKAWRFGIGTGKYGNWTGVSVVGRMEKWPTWTPTPETLQRHPDMMKYVQGMPGGDKNPMGARAIYLYVNNADTSYRVHGTDVPKHIGTKSTAGCFAMFNADVIFLYNLVQVGTRVVVLAA